MTGQLRSAGRAVAFAALAVLATGCIKAHQDLTLNSDNTVSGTVIFAVSKQFLSLSGQTVDDFLGSATASNAPVPSGVSAEQTSYDDGTYTGAQYTFSDAPLDAFSSEDQGALSIVREGDTFRVSGDLDLSGADSSGIDLNNPQVQQLLSTMDIQISITFPGGVSQHDPDAQVSGNTVTWKPQFGKTLQLSAVGSAIGSGGGSSSAVVWILIAAAVVLVLVIAIVLLARRRTGAPAPGEVEADVEPPADVMMAPPPTDGTPSPGATAGPSADLDTSAPPLPGSPVEGPPPAMPSEEPTTPPAPAGEDSPPHAGG
jgi:hypothetical protein